MTTPAPVFVYVTYITTTPEKLWEAITDGQFTRQYFFGRSVRSDWKAGSDVTYWRPDGELDVRGKVLKFDPPRLLSFTWDLPGDTTPREYSTIITFELQPMNAVVKLTLKHEHLLETDYYEASDSFRGLNNGWPAIMCSLKSLLETGQSLLFNVE